MLPRILCALVISHGLLVAQQAPAASSQVQPVAEPLPLLDTGIPGGIADGTPAVPAPLPEPLQFSVKRTLTSRRQVTEAPEIIGLPAVKGTINVTVQLVEDPGLPDPPPPLITPPVEEAATDGPAELSEPGPDCQFIFVSATVYDHARTYPFHNARGDVIAQFSTAGEVLLVDTKPDAVRCAATMAAWKALGHDESGISFELDREWVARRNSPPTPDSSPSPPRG